MPFAQAARLTDKAVCTRGLTKYYGDVHAVTGLDLDVPRGEIYAFLGRNGAGKTTTIRMLLGLVRPTAGDAVIFGTRIAPGVSSVFARVGYLVETATSYPNLTVRENLDIQRRLTHAPRTAVGEAMELLGLAATCRPSGRAALAGQQTASLARACCAPPARSDHPG